MKKLLVVAFMIAGTTSFAQFSVSGSIQNVTKDVNKIEQAGQKVDQQSQKMKTDLGLTDDQTAQLKAVFNQQVQAKEANNTQIQAVKAKGQKVNADKTAVDNQIKGILTPDQYAKWQSNIAAEKAKFTSKTPRI